MCWDCGELVINSNLHRHAKEQHDDLPGRLKRGKRPRYPKYENHKEIRDKPWSAIKILKGPQDPISPDTSFVSH